MKFYFPNRINFCIIDFSNCTGEILQNIFSRLIMINSMLLYYSIHAIIRRQHILT